MISGAAATLTFEDGTSYLMSPLSDRDIDEIDLYLQSRIIEISRAAIPPDATREDREIFASAALREASNVSMLSGRGVGLLSTVGGMTRLVWQSIKRNHPDVTLNELREQLSKEYNVRAANATFTKANANRLLKKEGKPGPKGKRKRR